MSLQFNPKRVLRQLSPPLLKEFFDQMGSPLAVDWSAATAHTIDDAFVAWQNLPDQQRKAIEVVFHDVHDMVTEDGLRVIIEEAVRCGEDLTPSLALMASRHDQALWTFMHHPTVWNAAVHFAKADTLSSGRSWTIRNEMPDAEPLTDAGTLEILQDTLSAFYRNHQGRGHHCKVDVFPRGTDQHYYFVYLSDYADTYINFDDAGHFQRTPERRAFEIVFAYDRSVCTLSMYAKGGKKILDPLQNMFSRIILGEALGPENPGSQPYQLDGLMDRTFGFPTDPADGIEEVQVRALRLSILGNHRGRITLEPDPQSGRERIYDMLDEDLNSRRLPRSVLQVKKATIHVRFTGVRRSFTFNITNPNGCDLKSKREEYRQLGEKYLRQWRIAVA
jgi:hypothetical protein